MLKSSPQAAPQLHRALPDHLQPFRMMAVEKACAPLHWQTFPFFVCANHSIPNLISTSLPRPDFQPRPTLHFHLAQSLRPPPASGYPFRRSQAHRDRSATGPVRIADDREASLSYQDVVDRGGERGQDPELCRGWGRYAGYQRHNQLPNNRPQCLSCQFLAGGS